MNAKQIIEQLKLDENQYNIHDISNEVWRKIKTKEVTHIIHEPQVLVIRKKGSTHRVVDSTGVTHCYPSESIILWKSKIFVDF